MQIIPAVDVLDGSVVRLLHGKYDQATTYAADPVEATIAWCDDGAALVHVVDLNGARSGRPDVDLWNALGSAGVVFQIGGGIRDARTAVKALEAGASRVVVGTAAIQSVQVLGEIVAGAGSDHLVVAIDVKEGRARGSGWTDDGIPLDDVVRTVADAGVQVVLVTGIERDGALKGPNVHLLDEVRSVAPGLQLIASGGVSSLADVTMLASFPCDGAIIGRALYEKRFTLPQAIRQAENKAKKPT